MVILCDSNMNALTVVCYFLSDGDGVFWQCNGCWQSWNKHFTMETVLWGEEFKCWKRPVNCASCLTTLYRKCVGCHCVICQQSGDRCDSLSLVSLQAEAAGHEYRADGDI